MTLDTQETRQLSTTVRRLGRGWRLLTRVLIGLFLLTSSPACGGEKKADGHGHGASEKDEHGHGDEHGGHEEEGEGDEHGHGHGEEGEHADEAKLTPEAIKRYGITVEAARKHPLLGTFSAPARVSYNTEAIAYVGSPVSGRIAEIRARLGDLVKKGDVLLIIESPELGEVQSDFRSKRAAVQAARSSYERASKLLKESQGIALTEVQKREVELKSAEAAASAAESTLKVFGFSPQAIESLAKSGNIDSRYPVHASLSGTVVERNASIGERVGPDRDSLFTIADTSTLWVIADVPEGRLKDVGVGSRARVKVPALPDQPLEGRVILVSPVLEQRTRTTAVRIEVKDERMRLKPGMFAQAEIASPEASAGAMLAVPIEAVQTVEGGPAVFVPVKGEENTFAKRAVSVGPAVGGLVPVLSGLKEGEPIVTAGTFILKAELGKAGAAHEH
jgi:cobalt-zinc-cadmium efflux system membrane fusion protein